ncbi:MAG: hypothetical protein OXL96_05685 [Candidatus Poribacteria bacterium]|nr:hypothetical protein [Candidatus Poribacteria bacterium]
MAYRNPETEQWLAWRDDYRSERPAVTCESCGAHYPRGKDTRNATYIGFSLKTCGACYRHNELKRASARGVLKLHRHIMARKNTPKGSQPIKEVHRDTAARYITRFHGSTFAVPTAEDNADIYLRNAFGLTIAKVLATDRYPRSPVEVFDLPF